MEADAAARWDEAERLNAAGRHQHARPLYAGLGSERMYAPLAHLRLSVLDQRAGDLRGATAQGLAAVSAAYGDPELLELLCKTLLPLGETRAALACATALAGMPAPLQALAEVGKLMSDHMQPEAALTLLQRAVAMGLAGAPAVRYLLGLNLMYLGRLDEARSELERSLAGNPEFAPAHWALSKVGPAPARGARIDRLRRLLERTESGARDAPLLWYSLFHELDGDDRPGEAWPALQTAMQLRRSQVQHDESAQDALFAAAGNALEWASGAGAGAALDAGPQPVFVVGMPRTGTTLIEQRLCAATDLASAGELRDLAVQMRWCAQQPGPFHLDARLLAAVLPSHLQDLGQRYLEHTQWRAQGASSYADKWPENYLAIGHILAAMPAARVLCVVRDPMDTCFSNLKEWFASSYYYSYDMAETARQYARFRRLLDRVQALAHPRVASVGYEAFVERPRDSIAAIAGALSLPARQEGGATATHTIATASAVQARDAISRGHMGAWRRYSQQLQPMLAELERCGVAASDA